MTVLTTNKINKILNKIENGEELKRSERIFYQGDVGILKKCNFLRTDIELNEFVKCSNDIIYFIEKYCLVDDRNITLYDYQEKILNTYVSNRFNITSLTRNSGHHVLKSLWVIWSLIFSEKNVISLNNKVCENNEIYETIKKIYKSIPYFLKHNIVSMNSKKIILSNNSSI